MQMYTKKNKSHTSGLDWWSRGMKCAMHLGNKSICEDPVKVTNLIDEFVHVRGDTNAQEHVKIPMSTKIPINKENRESK